MGDGKLNIQPDLSYVETWGKLPACLLAKPTSWKLVPLSEFNGSTIRCSAFWSFPGSSPFPVLPVFPVADRLRNGQDQSENEQPENQRK